MFGSYLFALSSSEYIEETSFVQRAHTSAAASVATAITNCLTTNTNDNTNTATTSSNHCVTSGDVDTNLHATNNIPNSSTTSTNTNSNTNTKSKKICSINSTNTSNATESTTAPTSTSSGISNTTTNNTIVTTTSSTSANKTTITSANTMFKWMKTNKHKHDKQLSSNSASNSPSPKRKNSKQLKRQQLKQQQQDDCKQEENFENLSELPSKNASGETEAHVQVDHCVDISCQTNTDSEYEVYSTTVKFLPRDLGRPENFNEIENSNGNDSGYHEISGSLYSTAGSCAGRSTGINGTGSYGTGVVRPGTEDRVRNDQRARGGLDHSNHLLGDFTANEAIQANSDLRRPHLPLPPPHGVPGPPNQPLPPLPHHQQHPTAPGTCTLPRRGLHRELPNSKVRSPSNPPPVSRQPLPNSWQTGNQNSSGRMVPPPYEHHLGYRDGQDHQYQSSQKLDARPGTDLRSESFRAPSVPQNGYGLEAANDRSRFDLNAREANHQNVVMRDGMANHDPVNRFSQLSDKYSFDGGNNQPQNQRLDNPTLEQIRAEQQLYQSATLQSNSEFHNNCAPDYQTEQKSTLNQQKSFDSWQENKENQAMVTQWSIRDQDSGIDSMGSRIGDGGPRSLSYPAHHLPVSQGPLKSTDDFFVTARYSDVVLNGDSGPLNSAYNSSNLRIEIRNTTNSPSNASQVLASDGMYPQSAANSGRNENKTYRVSNESPSPRKVVDQAHENRFRSGNLCRDDDIRQFQHHTNDTQVGSRDQPLISRDDRFLKMEGDVNYRRTETRGSNPHSSFEEDHILPNVHDRNFEAGSEDRSGSNRKETYPDPSHRESVLFIQESSETQKMQNGRLQGRQSNEGTYRARQVILTRGRDVRLRRSEDSRNDFHRPVHQNGLPNDSSYRRQTFSGQGYSDEPEPKTSPRLKSESVNTILCAGPNEMTNIDGPQRMNQAPQHKDFCSDGLTVRDQPSRSIGVIAGREARDIENLKKSTPRLQQSERENDTNCEEKDELQSSASTSWMEWTQQLQAYVAWVNSQLRKKDLPLISDLRRDLQSGEVLADLIEIIAGERVPGIQRQHPDLPPQQAMRDNIERILQFMSARRVKMVHINSKDVVEGNLKSIMRVILALAAHYKPQSVRCPPHGTHGAQTSQNIQVGSSFRGVSGSQAEEQNETKRLGKEVEIEKQAKPISRVPVKQQHGHKKDAPHNPTAPERTPDLSALRRGLLNPGAGDEPLAPATPALLRRQPSLGAASGIPRPCSPVYENLPRRSPSSRWAYDSLRASHKFQWGNPRSGGDLLPKPKHTQETQSKSPNYPENSQIKSASMNTSVNESMSESLNTSMNDSMNTSMNKSMNTSMNKQMNDPMNTSLDQNFEADLPSRQASRTTSASRISDSKYSESGNSSHPRTSDPNSSPSRPAALNFWEGLQNRELSESKSGSGGGDGVPNGVLNGVPNGVSNEVPTGGPNGERNNDNSSPFRYHTIHRMSGRRKLPQIPSLPPGGGSGRSSVTRGSPPHGGPDSTSPRAGDDPPSREPEGRSQNSSPAASVAHGDPWGKGPAPTRGRAGEGAHDVLWGTRDQLLALQDAAGDAEGCSRSPAGGSWGGWTEDPSSLAGGVEAMLRHVGVRGVSDAPPGGGVHRVQREEISLVRAAIGTLRTNFRSTDPNQHVLDTLEQAIGLLLEKKAPAGPPPAAGASSPAGGVDRRNHGGEPQTKVIYFTERTVTPFMSTIPKAIGDVRLRDFKQVFDRPGSHRYHFKSYDPEYGMVKEEIGHDDDPLPGVDGKIIAWVEEDEH